MYELGLVVVHPVPSLRDVDARSPSSFPVCAIGDVNGGETYASGCARVPGASWLIGIGAPILTCNMLCIMHRL